MRFYPFLLISALVCPAFPALAQIPDSQGTSLPPEQWQMTLDVIKSKAQSLSVENDGLMGQYRELAAQVQKLQQAVAEQQERNEQLERYLQDRHGRSDQQTRMDELKAAIRQKTQQARESDQELWSLRYKKLGLDKKIEGLKYMISGIELRRQAAKVRPAPVPVPVNDDRLAQLRNDLGEQNKQEGLLEAQLNALKVGSHTQNLNAGAIESENKQLSAQLDMLRLQKLRHSKRSSDTELSQAGARLYDHLRQEKEELEAKIYVYEMRMDQLKQSSFLADSWPAKRRRLVHQMAVLDGRNDRVANEIKELKQDIGVLKDQISKLERQDYARGAQGAK